jgi:replication factor C large subunit
VGELILPVAMAANFEDSDQVRKLAKISVVMRMRHVSARLLEIYVRDILQRERAVLTDEDILAAVASARGDVRAAINNIQSPYLSGNATEPVRDQVVGLTEAIAAATSAELRGDAVRMLREADGQPDEKLQAAFTTIVAADLPIERRRDALRALTEANVLLGHIMRTQRWRQLRYLDQLLATALYGLHTGYVAEDLPWPVKLRIWNDGRYIRSFEAYLAKRYHVSRADAASFFLHSVVLVFGRDPPLLKKVCQEAGLDEKATNAVEREYKLLIKELGE